MVDWLKTKWPQLLFAGTVAIGVSFLIISYIYAVKTSALAYNRQLYTDLKSDYEQQIADLNARRLIKTTITQTIPEVSTIQQCINMPFGQKICTAIPKVSQHEIQVPVESVDPDVQKKIDALTSKLQSLAQTTEQSQIQVADFRPLYDFVQNMMRPCISIVVLIASLFVILSKRYTSDVQKWAFGSFGTVLGFWLK